MSTLAQPPPEHASGREIYVPGYALPKLGLALLGLVLVALSMTKLGTVLRLAVVGESARAEAARVILVDAGGQESVLTQAVDVADAEKRLSSNKDRSISLWIEYRFTTAAGRTVEARSPIGNTLKTLHPYRDADGMPATIRIWYDPDQPTRIAIPFQFLPGTWFPFGFGTFFMPGMLLLFGIVGTWMGLLLFFHAHRPIVMPDLSQAHGEADGKGH